MQEHAPPLRNQIRRQGPTLHSTDYLPWTDPGIDTCMSRPGIFLGTDTDVANSTVLTSCMSTTGRRVPCECWPTAAMCNEPKNARTNYSRTASSIDPYR
jgi:hypothetical protein